MAIGNSEEFKTEIGRAVGALASIGPEVLEQLRMLIRKYELSKSDFERTINARKIISNYNAQLTEISSVCLMLEWELLPYLSKQLGIKDTLPEDQKNALGTQERLLMNLNEKIIELFRVNAKEKIRLFDVTSRISSIKHDAKKMPVDFEIKETPDIRAKVLTNLLREINVKAGRKKGITDTIFDVFSKIGYVSESQISARTPQNIATILGDIRRDVQKIIGILGNRDYIREIPEFEMLRNTLKLEWNAFLDTVFASMQRKAITSVAQKAEYSLPQKEQFNELQL